MNWINETPKQPKMCRVNVAVFSTLLAILFGIIALRLEIKPQDTHGVYPVISIEYVPCEG